jgi:WD40 repeat protein/tRNA A-37 threonylcarbamoyl transferase component Bud32
MGVVYRARQTKLNRLVALKMILRGELAGPQELARFQREAEAVAQLQHPNIVQIHEVGELCDGRPFFSFELIEGGSLAQKIRGTPQPIPEAVALVETLARAIHTAHQQGIIHRDLKPANVLLTADNQPKITDFGLAKRLDQYSGHTASGAIVGTPSYMAPEQVGGSRYKVGPAADVYALGTILYELLTGRPPFVAETPGETFLQVQNEEPVSPSLLRPKLPRDLETICLTCLAKSPPQRYGSALELAEDLKRFQAGEPIRARPTPVWERAVKWAKRRRGTAALLGVCCLLTLLLVGAFVIGNQRLQEKQQQLDEAAEREARARGEQAKLANELQDLQNAKIRDYFDRIARAQSELQARNFTLVRQILDDCPANLRNWEWHFLKRLCLGDALVLRHRGQNFSRKVEFSPDEQRITTSARGTTKVWDTTNGRELLDLPGVGRVVFHPDGRRFATTGLTGDDEGRLWDAVKGQEIAALAEFALADADLGESLLFSPAGNRLAWSGKDGSFKIGDATTAKELFTLPKADSKVVFSPDGKWVAAAWGKTVKVLDTTTGEELFYLAEHSDKVTSVCFSPDGQRLVAGSRDQTGKVWDVKASKVIATFSGNVAPVVFSADGERLLAIHQSFKDGEPGKPRGEMAVSVWDAATGQKTFTCRELVWGQNSVAVSSDAKRVAMATGQRVAKVWDTTSGQVIFSRKTEGNPFVSVALSPDGQRLVTVRGDPYKSAESAGSVVKVWDVTTGRELLVFGRHTGISPVPKFSSDGRKLATAGGNPIAPGAFGVVKIYDVTAGLTLRGHTDRILRLAFSADEQRLASASADKTVKIWDATTGVQLFHLPGHTGVIHDIAFRSDGQRLASASADKTLKIWDLKTGKTEHTLSGHAAPVLCVAFRADGQRLASGSEDGTVKLWDAAGQEVRSLKNTTKVTSIAFSRDGNQLAAAVGDGVTVWNADSGQEVHHFPQPGGKVTPVIFSPVGGLLAAVADNQTITVWDVASRKVVRTFQPKSEVVGVAFSSDAERLATASANGTVQIWEPRTGRVILTLNGLANPITSGAFSAGGSRFALGTGDNTIKLP